MPSEPCDGDVVGYSRSIAAQMLHGRPGGRDDKPHRLRKREILTAQLASGQPVGSTFTRGAGAALRLLTAGGPGPLTVWRVQVLEEGQLELGQGQKGPQTDHVRAI